MVLHKHLHVIDVLWLLLHHYLLLQWRGFPIAFEQRLKRQTRDELVVGWVGEELAVIELEVVGVVGSLDGEEDQIVEGHESLHQGLL